MLKSLPPEGVILGDVHIGVQQWDGVQEGVVMDTRLTSGSASCPVWLADAGWRAWCEAHLGTDDAAGIDAVLLAEIAEWAMQPLLKACNARGEQRPFALRACSLLPGQIAVTFSWQVEQQRFQALLLGNASVYLERILAGLKPQVRSIGTPLPLMCGVYVGWSRLTLCDLRKIATGVGLRLCTFGDPNAGEFALLIAQRIAARIRFHGENEMHINALVQDIESLLDAEQQACPLDERLPLDLDALPQTLLVEVGQVEITVGALRTMNTGDILPVEVGFSSTVTLRLNGRAMGQGELVRCGSDFLVRVCRWYPMETAMAPLEQDEVIAW